MVHSRRDQLRPLVTDVAHERGDGVQRERHGRRTAVGANYTDGVLPRCVFRLTRLPGAG
jgi:hypothetical protein